MPALGAGAFTPDQITIFLLSLMTLLGAARVLGEVMRRMGQPQVLGEIIAAGTDANGRLYVVEEAGSGNRVFVSNEGVLSRWRVLGSGQGTDNGARHYAFTIERDGEALSVLVEITDGVTVMAVADEDYEGRIDDLGEDGEILALASESMVRAMPVENLPGEVEVEDRLDHVGLPGGE